MVFNRFMTSYWAIMWRLLKSTCVVSMAHRLYWQSATQAYVHGCRWQFYSLRFHSDSLGLCGQASRSLHSKHKGRHWEYQSGGRNCVLIIRCLHKARSWRFKGATLYCWCNHRQPTLLWPHTCRWEDEDPLSYLLHHAMESNTGISIPLLHISFLVSILIGMTWWSLQI